MAESLNSAIKSTGTGNSNCLPEQWLLRNVSRPPGQTPCWRSVPTQALHPHLWLINTNLGLPTRPARATVSDLGSPGAANYFAHSKEQYFAHSPQQRWASSAAQLHLPLCGAALQGFDDKGPGSTTSQERETVKGRQHSLPRGPALQGGLWSVSSRDFVFHPGQTKPACTISLPCTKKKKGNGTQRNYCTTITASLLPLQPCHWTLRIVG